MGKIYSTPDNIKEPKFDFSDISGTRKAESDYLEQVKEYCKTSSEDKVNIDYIGEEFDIPMADGYARYMVYSIKPLIMIHLNIGDAWDSPMANQVNAKYVKQYIDGQRNLAKMFPKRF